MGSGMDVLSEANSQLFDQFIDAVLQKVIEGAIDQASARNSLKKAVILAATGNPNIAFFLESQLQGILDQGSPRR